MFSLISKMYLYKYDERPGLASSEGDSSLCYNFIFSSEGSKHAVHQKIFQEQFICNRFDEALKCWATRNLDLAISELLSSSTSVDCKIGQDNKVP